jgi:hypothetical protein
MLQRVRYSMCDGWGGGLLRKPSYAALPFKRGQRMYMVSENDEVFGLSLRPWCVKMMV